MVIVAGFPFRWHNAVVKNESRIASSARLPSVNIVLETEPLRSALSEHPRSLLVRCVRDVLTELRSKGLSNGNQPSAAEVASLALARVMRTSLPSLRRVINATGVVLHTGLGRSVLSRKAAEAVSIVATSHSSLEIDLESGRRGSRTSHVKGLLMELTGAENALVLNNNAGAVFLAVHVLASGREVVISRGELVEIGGSFRMPDIIRSGGAALVEVGTTNRTRLRDYEDAITERTAMFLRCHPSNFRITGFTEATSIEELAALGRSRGIPVVDDLGSGALFDVAHRGLMGADTLRAALARGADLVTASGDKLLGGPQAGIVIGRKDLVEQLAKHPLARALRVDKMTLAALEATLRSYRDPERAVREIPTLRYLARTEIELRRMALGLARAIRKRCPEHIVVDCVRSDSQAGGGSLPEENLPTVCVRIRGGGAGFSASILSERLRTGELPVLARIKDGAVLLDPRAMEAAEFLEVAEAICLATS